MIWIDMFFMGFRLLRTKLFEMTLELVLSPTILQKKSFYFRDLFAAVPSSFFVGKCNIVLEFLCWHLRMRRRSTPWPWAAPSLTRPSQTLSGQSWRARRTWGGTAGSARRRPRHSPRLRQPKSEMPNVISRLFFCMIWLSLTHDLAVLYGQMLMCLHKCQMQN